MGNGTNSHVTTTAPRPGRFRRAAGNVLIILTVAFTVYLSIIMLRRINTVVLTKIYKRVFRNELVICAVFILFALDLRFGLFTRIRFLPARVLGWIIRGAVVAAAVFLLAVCARVVGNGMLRNTGSTEHIIVLGMALEDGKPTKDLLLRLETAQRCAERNPKAVLIVTGGNPDEMGRTEGMIMRELLTERGFPQDRIIVEDEASDTIQNFRNTARMLDSTEPVAVVSSNYHMGRAIRIAKEAGFTEPLRLPAPSDPLDYGANVMWEVIMEINTLKIKGKR